MLNIDSIIKLYCYLTKQDIMLIYFFQLLKKQVANVFY